MSGNHLPQHHIRPMGVGAQLIHELTISVTVSAEFCLSNRQAAFKPIGQAGDNEEWVQVLLPARQFNKNARYG